MRRFPHALASLAFLSCLAVAEPARAQRCPNVMIDMQRSGSMGTDVNGGNNPPSKLQLAIANLTKATVPRPTLRYGLTSFAAMGGGGACAAGVALDLAPGSNQQPLLLQKLNALVAQGNSNVGDSVSCAATNGKLDDATRDNFILLVTTGSSNCSSPEPETTRKAIAAAAARNPPVKTIVVSFPGLGIPADINAWALAGGMPRDGGKCGGKGQPDCYYHAEDIVDVTAAIKATTPGNAPCGCDDSCLSSKCPADQRCEIAMPGATAACVPDPCNGKSCLAGSYCRNGQCVEVCPVCASGQKCDAGKCVADPCAGKVCGPGQVCAGGACITDQCEAGMVCCPVPSTCDPVNGACVSDPCTFLTCPVGSFCTGGYCATTPPPDMAVASTPDLSLPPVVSDDLGMRNDSGTPLPLPPSDSGCSCAVGSPGRSAGTTGWMALALLAMVLSLRARRCRD